MSTEEACLSEAHHAVSDAALDTLFREAHTTRKWLDKKVSPALLMAIYDVMRWGPTATNITPARIDDVDSMRWHDALKVGIAQAFALLGVRPVWDAAERLVQAKAGGRNQVCG